MVRFVLWQMNATICSCSMMIITMAFIYFLSDLVQLFPPQKLINKEGKIMGSYFFYSILLSLSFMIKSFFNLSMTLLDINFAHRVFL